MNEVQIVQQSDYLTHGTTLTATFPEDIAPVREGVYLVQVLPGHWRFAFYSVERVETYFPEPGQRGRKQHVNIPGHWSEPADAVNDAARNVAKRDFRKTYKWIGLAYKH